MCHDRRMRIAVIGASGWLGGTIAREALARGHEVTAIGRDATRLQAIQGAQPATADVTDPGSLQRVLAGHDIVVSAVTDRSTDDSSIIPRTARTLLDVLPAAGVRRLAVVGGGGSLEEERGERVVDRPDFPEAYKAEALAQAAALEVYRESETAVDWTYLSPPPHHLIPGESEAATASRAAMRQSSTATATAASQPATSPPRCSTRSSDRSSRASDSPRRIDVAAPDRHHMDPDRTTFRSRGW
jgi:uncharacterized protein